MVEDTMEVIGLTNGRPLTIPTKLGEFVGESGDCVLETLDAPRAPSTGTSCSAVITYVTFG